MEFCQENVKDMLNNSKEIAYSVHNIQKQIDKGIMGDINNVSNISNISTSNNNVQPVTVHQNITLNCPNVTNNSGVEYLQKELGHLSQRAEQEAHKR